MTYTRITTIISMVALAVAVTVGSAQADVEDVLLEKGVITKEDWLKIKADKEKAKQEAKEQAKEQKEQEVQILRRQEKAKTEELIVGSGFDKIRFKNVTISPGGFAEATVLNRSANENADVASNYRDLPLSGSTNAKLSEFRGTVRNSRLSVLAETQVAGLKQLSAYVEADFLGAAPTANETESNSWTPRLRQYWTNADLSGGTSIMLGQGWSLLTLNRQGLRPRTEFVPVVIDAQYVVGYNWARQFQLRVTQEFGSGVWGALSVENPETNTPQVILPANVQGFENSPNTLSPTQQINGGAVSTDQAPDLIAKMVFEPGWGHWELKALGRFFRDRLNGGNHHAFGGGVGAGAILPLHPNLNLIVEGLSGAGIGRYASGVGADVIAKTDGTVVPIRATQILTGLEWHPTPAWDVYNYYGLEYYDKAAYEGTNFGYGSELNNLSGCSNETFGTCQAANKTLWQIAPGFWYRFLEGNAGIAAFGVAYSYVHRQLWAGAGGLQPNGRENIVYASFRYYLP